MERKRTQDEAGCADEISKKLDIRPNTEAHSESLTPTVNFDDKSSRLRTLLSQRLRTADAPIMEALLQFMESGQGTAFAQAAAGAAPDGTHALLFASHDRLTRFADMSHFQKALITLHAALSTVLQCDLTQVGSAIQLPDAFFVLGLVAEGSQGPQLFVRRSYIDLYQAMGLPALSDSTEQLVRSTTPTTPQQSESEMHMSRSSHQALAQSADSPTAPTSLAVTSTGTPDGSTRVVGIVNGTPGVGKTTFGVYVLLRLLQARPQEMIVWVEDQYSLIFKGGHVSQLEGTFNPWSTSCHWLLYNAVRPSATIPKTVNVLLFTSPKKQVWLNFAKQLSVRTWYMPLWEWPEICELRKKCYAAVVTEQELLERFSRFGKVARLLMGKPVSDIETAMQQLTNGALGPSLAKDSIAAVGSQDVPDGVAHLIVHLAVDPADLTKASIVLASRHIAELLTRQVEAEAQLDSLKLVATAAGTAALGALRGSVFEHVAHRYLSASPKCRVRRLFRDKAAQDVLLQLTTSRLEVVPEFPASLAMGVYYIPVSRNVANVDAISADAMFQMTIATSHPVKGQYILDLSQRFGLTKLVFVVPTDVFPHFGYQQHHRLQADPATKSSLLKDQTAFDKIEQYVLCVESV